MHKATRQSTPAVPDYPIKTGLLHTGQIFCYDENGTVIPCPNSGQDGEFRLGLPWPEPRFSLEDRVVFDHLTGFTWPKDANLGESPMTWQEAFAFIAGMNRRKWSGFDDWRLPNRRELRSLMSYQTKKPSLPDGHPFTNIFLGWYWTSTTAAIHPAYAWRLHLEGVRMFYGRKDEYSLLWPVRGAGYDLLPKTGQKTCHDGLGRKIPCPDSGQDGEHRLGLAWPQPRFTDLGETVFDNLTRLIWLKDADLSGKPMSWSQALARIGELNRSNLHGSSDWRLPDINALESLVDCAQAEPALPAGHPFRQVREAYWSSTTSFFETDWAWALYLHKGALGVGHKKGESFFAWPVRLAGEQG
ncbi:MAG: Lcl C-terminal domain-containing protein [Desulfurivibrionaceae bacterium]